jgi:hypothetical protein
MEVQQMNPLDRLLHEELARLLDRIATSAPDGDLGCALAGQPALRARLDEMDQRLATLRGILLETYGTWGRALEDLENLWALVAWQRDEASVAA